MSKPLVLNPNQAPIAVPTATPDTDGAMSGEDKAKLDSIPFGGGGVTPYPSEADFPSAVDHPNELVYAEDITRVFVSEGGVWRKVNQPTNVTQVISVGLGGDVHFTSVRDAVEYAKANGASASTPFLINVAPGDYTEQPIVVTDGINIVGPPSTFYTQARLIAADLNTDFITFDLDETGVTAGMSSFKIMGPTNATAIQTQCPFGAFSAVSLQNLDISRCLVGVKDNLDISTQMAQVTISVFTPGDEVGTGFWLVGTGDLFNCGAVAPDTTGFAVNPIQTALLIDGTFGVTLFNTAVYCAALDNTAVGIKLDNGASVIWQGGYVVLEAIGVQIGAGGANTFLAIQDVYLDFNTLNIDVQSATGFVLCATITTSVINDQTVPGGTITGIQIQYANQSVNITGNTDVRYISGRTANLPAFVQQTQRSGVNTGGVVSDAGGLNVDISAGSGWVVRNSPFDDAQDLEWGGATLTLVDNTTNYVFIDSTTLAATSSLTAPSDENITLAIVVTKGGAIQYNHRDVVLTSDVQTIQDYLYSTQKTVLNSGLATSIGSGPTKFDVDIGSYWLALDLIEILAMNDATFNYFYGMNGASELPGSTDVDTVNYDNAGVLTAMTAGWFRSDSLYITSDGRLSLIYGTQEYAVQNDAAQETIASPYTFLEQSAFPLSKLVVQQGVGIVEVVDQRTVTARSNVSVGLSHGTLSGLGADDHVQYLLASGARPMAGNLAMGGFAVSGASTYNGVDVANHHVRHQPGGIDAIPTAVVGALVAGASSSEGVAASIARSDHGHGVPTAAPSTISTANSEGVSTSLARADHVHSHGNLAGGSLHSNATTLTAGFMSAADKTKVDNAATLTSSAPVDVTKSAAQVGVATDAARADHKHDIATATATTISTVNSEGVSTSLSRADHTHSHGNQAGGNLHAVATTLTAGFMSAADKTKVDASATLTSSAPVNVTKSAAVVGVATDAARADHKHDIDTAAPSTISTANSEGTSSSLARADHVHNHGNLAGGALHDAATGATAGFMSAADKSKLDGIATGAAALTSSAPVNVTKAAAAVGVSTDAARADHKHDITTAAASSLTPGGANAEGSASSLARSDHTHALPAFGTSAGTFAQGNDARIGAVQSATGNVSAAASPAPSAGQVLTALSGTTAQWSTPSAGSPTATVAQSAAPTTTNSAADVVMSGMTLTPAAGTYVVWFTGDVSNSNSASVYTSIYSAGSQVTASFRTFTRGAQGVAASFMCMAKVTVTGVQAIEGRWSTSAGIASNNARQLFIMQVI